MYIRAGAFCMAMPIDIFLQGCAAGQYAIAEWRREADERQPCQVVPFKRTIPCLDDSDKFCGS